MTVEYESLELLVLSICIILSAFFSGAEAVLMSIGTDRARQMIEEGGRSGRALNFMIDRPNELLATILVGNNIVNIWAAAIVTFIATRTFDSNAIGFATGTTTVVVLIFGEVLPKAFGRNNAEKLSAFVIRSLQFFYYLLFPIVKGLVALIRMVLGAHGELSGRIVTKNDLEYMINRAGEEKTIDSKQIDLLTSIMEFPTIKVKDIMVPRSKVNYIQYQWSYQEIMVEVKADVHSRYPVCDGELENMKGFLHVKDVAFLSDEEKAGFKLDDYLKSPFFVYEHMKIQAVFDHMNRKKVHLALVKDENGLIVGIVTLEDIVEEILGEIQDEHDDEEWEGEGEFNQSELIKGIVVEGSISLRDLYNDYDIKIPLNDNYSTLAGFILDMLGNNFPEEGQIIVWEGLTFGLDKVDEYEIREIRIRDVDGEKHLFSKRDAENAHENGNGNGNGNGNSTVTESTRLGMLTARTNND
jgi:putative hemolysin